MLADIQRILIQSFQYFKRYAYALTLVVLPISLIWASYILLYFEPDDQRTIISFFIKIILDGFILGIEIYLVQSLIKENRFDVLNAIKFALRFIVMLSAFYFVYRMAIVFGLFLLIIPGVIVGVRFFSVPYLITFRKYAFQDAARHAFDVNGGHFWKILGALGIPAMVVFMIDYVLLLSLKWMGFDHVIQIFSVTVIGTILNQLLIIISFLLYEDIENTDAISELLSEDVI